MRKKILWLLSVLVTVVLLALLFRKADFARVLSFWKTARPFPLLLVLPLSFLTNCWLATFKWRTILIGLGLPISFRRAFLIKMGSTPIKSILPLRTGEVSRVVYLKRRYNFSIVKSTGSIVIELFFNVLVFVLVIALGGAVLGVNPAGIFYWSALFIGGLLLIFASALHRSPRRWVSRLLARLPYPRLRGGLETFFTLHRYFSYRQIGLIFLYSLLIQFGKILTFYLINLSFGLDLPPEAYFVFLPLSVVISTVPISFLGIGLREGSLATLIPEFCPVSPAAVLGSALMFSVAEYVFPALLGLGWTGKFTAEIIDGDRKGGVEEPLHLQ